MTVGEKIKAARIELGMTQLELEKLTGINAANIRKYEAGKQNPKFETRVKLAEALQIPVTELIDGEKIGEDIEKIKEKFLEIFTHNNAHLMRVIQSSSDISEIEQYLISEKVSVLLDHFEKLNEDGQAEAIKRLEELTQIPRYQKKA